MPTLLEHEPHIQERPHPSSHDCGQEHSLDHWLEVYWLVEEDYLFAQDADSEPHAPVTETRQHSPKSAVRHRK
jgi:hypothetical protein